MKIVKSLKQSELLIKVISETIKNEAKEQEDGFLSMLLGTLAASILRSRLTERGIIAQLENMKIFNASHYASHASYYLTNFEIQKHYQNEPRFNGAYSRNNFSKIKDGEYIINLSEYKSIGTHWISLYLNAKDVTYFGSFGVEHILKEI